MVERRRRAKPDGRRNNGGARPNRLGSVSEAKKVARARAQMTGTGMNPHELLRNWADTGVMAYPGGGGRKAKTVELTPADRISCAKGCAAYYKAPLQAIKVTGDAEKPIVLSIDEATARALSAGEQETLLGLLKLIGAGGAGMEALAGQSTGADPGRYAATLTAESETEGRA